MNRFPVRAGWPLLLLLLGGAALWAGWVGYIASDDALYYAGARHWLAGEAFPGDTHWSTRFPLVLSFAAVLATLGRNLTAFAATALLFHLLLVGMTGLYARAVAGVRAGWIAAVIAATLPVVVQQASTVGVDLLEAALLLGGALLVGRPGAAVAQGLAGGVLFGLAMLCRETTVLPLAGLGVLFLLGRPVDRRVLLAAGLGAAVVLGLEALVQGWATGEPLRRYAIAFHHDEHIDRAANMEGNLLLHPVIDPVLVLLVNDDFGLLFWLLPVAAGTAWRLPAAGRARLLVLAAMAAASFALVSVLYTKLVLNPRYFMLAALVAVVTVAAWLDRLAARLRWPVLAGLVAGNLLLLGVGNAHPRWEMEALLHAAAAHPGEPVHGSANAVARAAVSQELGSPGTLSPAVPGPGALVLVGEGAAGGPVVARYRPPPTRVGAIVRAAGLEPLVPGAIRRRLLAPGPTYVLRRAPG